MSYRPRVETMDAADGLRTLPDGSVDAVVTDPPYAEVDRAYGRLTETQWRDLMDGVVAETRRVLAPTGSAVFILQPNSERVGRMRPWLFRWMADMAETWNLIQDAWWWNTTAVPTVHCNRTYGLMRPSMKACVWLGEPTCYRDQGAVLWSPAQENVTLGASGRALRRSPSGHGVHPERMYATTTERGGATPYNVLPISNTSSNGTRSAGAKGHGAGTPYPLAAWWVRYISPVGGVVVDPFAGTGTMGHAALDQGRLWWGCDSDPQWACLDGDTMPTMPIATA